MIRAAILDDYQDVALKFADWSAIAKDVEIKVFDKPFDQPGRGRSRRCRALPSSSACASARRSRAG